MIYDTNRLVPASPLLEPFPPEWKLVRLLTVGHFSGVDFAEKTVRVLHPTSRRPRCFK